MVYNLWAVAIVMIVIATGAAFGTLFVNVSKKAHAMITIQSNLISELSEEGRLIAYELNDPLFKLIDSAIAKKVKQKKAAPQIIQYQNDDGTYVPKVRSPNPKSAVVPRYSANIPLKLFDFVKFKKYKVIRDGKGTLMAEKDGPSENQLYVIIAVNDWTIINTPNNIPGRIYYNIEHNKSRRTTTIPLKPSDKRVLREDGVERLESPRKLTMEENKVFAYSEEEIIRMSSEEQASIEPHLDSRIAKEAIFGNHDYMNTPDFIHQQGFDFKTDKENMGSIKEDSNVLVLPINITQFNLTKMKKAHSNFEEILAQVSAALRSSNYVDTSDIREANIINNQTFKTLFDLIQDSLTKLFINDTLLPEGSHASPVTTKPKDLTLAYRVKENINLLDLTALDLIHIRYSLIENVVFKYFTDNKDLDQSELQMIYKDRRDKFPTTENLIREILPSLKNYVDDKDRAEFENFRTHRGMLAHGTTDMELTHFAERFNKLLNLEPNTYRAHDNFTGITKQGTLPSPAITRVLSEGAGGAEGVEGGGFLWGAAARPEGFSDARRYSSDRSLPRQRRDDFE